MRRFAKTHLPCLYSPISTYFQDFTLPSVALRWSHLQVTVHQECTKNTAPPHFLELLDSEEDCNFLSRP
jgi:hypothetical protein